MFLKLQTFSTDKSAICILQSEMGTLRFTNWYDSNQRLELHLYLQTRGLRFSHSPAHIP
jgi:hypothetical protein